MQNALISCQCAAARILQSCTKLHQQFVKRSSSIAKLHPQFCENYIGNLRRRRQVKVTLSFLGVLACLCTAARVVWCLALHFRRVSKADWYVVREASGYVVTVVYQSMWELRGGLRAFLRVCPLSDLCMTLRSERTIRTSVSGWSFRKAKALCLSYFGRQRALRLPIVVYVRRYVRARAVRWCALYNDEVRGPYFQYNLLSGDDHKDKARYSLEARWTLVCGALAGAVKNFMWNQ